MVATAETVHYLDAKFFSRITSNKYKNKEEMVMHHIRYIDKKAVTSLGDSNIIIDNIAKINKRIDSRVALKMIVALPNDIKPEQYEDWLELLRNFICDNLNVDKQNFYAVIHEESEIAKQTGIKNLHTHIVLTPIDRTTKKPINLSAQVLKNLHDSWDRLLESKGYSIKREEESKQLGKLGVALHYDKELKNKYVKHVKNKYELESIDEELQKLVAEEEKTQQNKKEMLRRYITDGELRIILNDHSEPEEPKPAPASPEPKPTITTLQDTTNKDTTIKEEKKQEKNTTLNEIDNILEKITQLNEKLQKIEPIKISKIVQSDNETSKQTTQNLQPQPTSRTIENKTEISKQATTQSAPKPEPKPISQTHTKKEEAGKTQSLSDRKLELEEEKKKQELERQNQEEQRKREEAERKRQEEKRQRRELIGNLFKIVLQAKKELREVKKSKEELEYLKKDANFKVKAYAERLSRDFYKLEIEINKKIKQKEQPKVELTKIDPPKTKEETRKEAIIEKLITKEVKGEASQKIEDKKEVEEIHKPKQELVKEPMPKTDNFEIEEKIYNLTGKKKSLETFSKAQIEALKKAIKLVEDDNMRVQGLEALLDPKLSVEQMKEFIGVFIEFYKQDKLDENKEKNINKEKSNKKGKSNNDWGFRPR